MILSSRHHCIVVLRYKTNRSCIDQDSSRGLRVPFSQIPGYGLGLRLEPGKFKLKNIALNMSLTLIQISIYINMLNCLEQSRTEDERRTGHHERIVIPARLGQNQKPTQGKPRKRVIRSGPTKEVSHLWEKDAGLTPDKNTRPWLCTAQRQSVRAKMGRQIR